MRSLLETGASLLLKVAYDSGQERTIGFATDLTYTVVQGQKTTFVVDTPFPAEIPQGAAPSFVRGSLTIYLPKGTTPESAGLVPYRVGTDGQNLAVLSRYLSFRIYDRTSNGLVAALDHCKVGQYTVNIATRSVVKVNLTFEGMLLTPGTAI